MTRDVNMLRYVVMVLSAQNDALLTRVRTSDARIAALGVVLMRKGLLSIEEWQEAIAEGEAGRAVHEALHPPPDAASRLLKRVIREELSEEQFQQLLSEAMKEQGAPEKGDRKGDNDG